MANEEYQYEEEVLDSSYDEVEFLEEEEVIEEFDHLDDNGGLLMESVEQGMRSVISQQQDPSQSYFNGKQRLRGRVPRHPSDEIDAGAERPMELRSARPLHEQRSRELRRAVDPPGSTLLASKDQDRWRGSDPEPTKIPPEAQESSLYEHASSKIAGIPQPSSLSEEKPSGVPQAISFRLDSMSSFDEAKHEIVSTIGPSNADIEARTNAVADYELAAPHEQLRKNAPTKAATPGTQQSNEKYLLKKYEEWWGWTESLLLIFFILVIVVVALVVLYFVLVDG